MPNVHVDTAPLKAARRAAPKIPSTNDVRRSTAAVRATRSISLDPAASAICRTPLWLTPIPARLCVRLKIELYNPTSPTPAGPMNIAIAFDRTTLTAMLTTDAPPITADDFRICLYEL